MKGAYALTEPGSGSDALAARTTATLTPDGTGYALNGQKIWITNGGFADVFTVFAKIGGDHFSAFIVERNTPGLSFGEEEHKMGIKGSSTRQLFFENCVVPKENLLGEIGRGHDARNVSQLEEPGGLALEGHVARALLLRPEDGEHLAAHAVALVGTPLDVHGGARQRRAELAHGVEVHGQRP